MKIFKDLPFLHGVTFIVYIILAGMAFASHTQQINDLEKQIETLKTSPENIDFETRVQFNELDKFLGLKFDYNEGYSKEKE